MGKIDNAEDGEDKSVAEGEYCVDTANADTVEQILQKLSSSHPKNLYFTFRNVPLFPFGSILMRET